MESSPLTQQARPEVFQQKIVELYESLFKVGPVPVINTREHFAHL
jgi:hypothetical protein